MSKRWPKRRQDGENVSFGRFCTGRGLSTFFHFAPGMSRRTFRAGKLILSG